MTISRRVLGLMSGTSADGIDAVVCDLSGSGASLRAVVVGHEWHPFEPELQARVLRAGSDGLSISELARLNVELGERFAAAALACIERFGPVDLIGSHGQTVCHLPDEGVTLQIGEPAIIAARTGMPVVADFRPADMAVGGQGAPLVPYADWVLFRHHERNRVLLNIGGIANCTVLPAGCSLDQVRGWDTGPGNMVLDYWAREIIGENFDEGGRAAGTGTVIEELLALWMGHEYFQVSPPKTTGREEFGASFAEMARPFAGSGADVLATAARVTARSIARSLRRDGGMGDFELYVSGGGARNGYLMGVLGEELPGTSVQGLSVLGVEAEHKEALAFAILAHETMNGVAGNVPSVTGASRPVILGKVVRG